MMNVNVYGKNVTINSDLPAFNYLTKEERPFVIVHAYIKSQKGFWKEAFKVSSADPIVAKDEIQEIIQFFNDTIRTGEAERTLDSLVKPDPEVDRFEDGQGLTGWLDPKGEFHACAFGCHSVYAMELEEREGSDALESNQHIPMSEFDQSGSQFISIMGEITDAQLEWFNRFYYKLSMSQRVVVEKKVKEQGKKLKYTW